MSRSIIAPSTRGACASRATRSRRARRRPRLSDRRSGADARGALDRILEHQYLRACNGCELDLARSAGADLVLLGRFNKISTLIGSMSIAVEDARSGALLYAQSFGFAATPTKPGCAPPNSSPRS